MKRWFCAALWMMMLVGMTAGAQARECVETDLSGYFGELRGSFVLLDESGGTCIRYNPEQSDKRLSPCSTFKIPNSLIGLETGVLQDENTVFPWDGTLYSIEAWNRDHSLQTAVPNSVVWYYREMARRVGEEKMKQWVHRLQYGNEDISGGVDKFWLQSTLKISAMEQVEFMSRLARGTLPVSARSMDIVKKVMTISETDSCVFRGKTGGGIGEKQIDGRTVFVLGWFVGFATRKDTGKVYVFACNVEGEKDASGMKARSIVEAVLKDRGILN